MLRGQRVLSLLFDVRGLRVTGFVCDGIGAFNQIALTAFDVHLTL